MNASAMLLADEIMKNRHGKRWQEDDDGNDLINEWLALVDKFTEEGRSED